MSDKNWKDDVSLWPEFEQIYSYLIDTPGEYIKKMLKANKSLEAFNYYIYQVGIRSKPTMQKTFFFFVVVVGCRQMFCCDLLSNCSLKAKVKASQRLTDTPHEAWVCIEKKTLNVITGHCTCMAG